MAAEMQVRMTPGSHSKQKPPYPRGLVQWARQDLNLQPTDYESAAARFADLGKHPKS